MAEPVPGTEGTPNPSGGDETPQNEPYIAFNTKEEFGKQQSKVFSKGYNEAQSSVIGKLTAELGVDADNVDTLIQALKSANQPAPLGEGDDANEIAQIKELLANAKAENEAIKGEFDSFKLSSRISSEATSALAELDGEMTISKDDVMALFKGNYDIVTEGNNLIVSQNGQKVLNDAGDSVTMAEQLKSFVENKGFISSTAEGTGGSGGSASTKVDKPSKSEWGKLIRSSSPSANDLAAQMYEKALQVGWAE